MQYSKFNKILWISLQQWIDSDNSIYCEQIFSRDGNTCRNKANKIYAQKNNRVPITSNRNNENRQIVCIRNNIMYDIAGKQASVESTNACSSTSAFNFNKQRDSESHFTQKLFAFISISTKIASPTNSYAFVSIFSLFILRLCIVYISTYRPKSSLDSWLNSVTCEYARITLPTASDSTTYARPIGISGADSP